MARPDLRNIEPYETKRGSRYRVQMRTGSGRRVNKSFDQLTDAQNFRDRLAPNLRAGKQPPAPERSPGEPGMSLADFILDVWWEKHARRELQETTRNGYFAAYKKWIDPSDLAELDISKIDAEDILDWQEWARGKGVTEPMLREAQKLISAAFTYAAARPKRYGVTANPVASSKWPEQKRQHQPEVFSAQVVEAVRRAILGRRRPPWYRQRGALVLSLMALTGMRPQEARAVQLRDCRRQVIALDETKIDLPRTVPLWTPLRDEIDAWAKRAGLGPDDFVLANLDRRRMSKTTYDNWRNRLYNPARDGVAGVDPEGKRPPKDRRLAEAWPYDLCRHSFAAHCLAGQMPLATLAKIMGHRVDTLSRHYTAVIEDYRGQPAIDPVAEVVRVRGR